MDNHVIRLPAIIAKLADGQDLSRDEARRAFEVVMTGEASEAQVAAFLMGLRIKGETVDEIAGAAEILRAKAQAITAPRGAIDTCGTGGDGLGTYNVSTCAAIVIAACGVPVAKHGNKAATSKSGSTEVLAALGINHEAALDHIVAGMHELGIGYMTAPRHHAAMRHVAGVRKSLELVTIFNLLGPLVNPAGAQYQLIGVFAEKWLEPVARTLGALGARRAWVVHGSDGLDELTVTGPSHVVEWTGTDIRRFTVEPADVGLATHPLEDLVGGDPDHNAAALRRVLAGETSAYRDIVLLNSAAALVVAGKTESLKEGVAMAAKAVDDGAAAALLERWIRWTQADSHDQP